VTAHHQRRRRGTLRRPSLGRAESSAMGSGRRRGPVCRCCGGNLPITGAWPLGACAGHGRPGGGARRAGL